MGSVADLALPLGSFGKDFVSLNPGFCACKVETVTLPSAEDQTARFSAVCLGNKHMRFKTSIDAQRGAGKKPGEILRAQKGGRMSISMCSPSLTPLE